MIWTQDQKSKRSGIGNPMYGKVPWNKGVTTPDDIRVKIRDTLRDISPFKKKYFVVSPQGTEYEVFGLNHLCRTFNLDQPTMSKVASGKRKSCKGWTCKEIKEKTINE